jgi:hypothetical protein
VVKRFNVFEANGQLRNTVEIDYAKQAAGLSLTGWRYAHNHVVPTRGIRRIYTVKVERIELNPPVTAADVRLEPTRGMVVLDELNHQGYILGEDGQRTMLGPGARANQTGWRVGWIVVAVCVAIAVVVVLMVKRRRSRRQMV